MRLYDVKIVVTDDHGNKLAFNEVVDMEWTENKNSGVDTTHGVPEHIREKCAIDQVKARHPFVRNIVAKGSCRHSCEVHDPCLRR